MLDNIDKVAAANKLEQYAAEVTAEVDDRLAAFVKDRESFWVRNKIEQVGNPTSWRIVQQDDNDGSGKDEVIFTVQGVIASKALPPLLERPRLPADKYKYLRQSITLWGVGTPTFKNALEAAKSIHDRFDRQFAEKTLDAWTNPDTGDQACLDISNRYFTPKEEAQGLGQEKFLPGVDPRGILRDLARGDGISSYVHTEDNQVLYFTTYRDPLGIKRYIPCEPQTFRLGDIVQAQVSFVVVPMKGGRRKMLTVLRSLALVDGHFGTVENRARNDQPSTGMASLKRRIGYENRSNKRYEMEVDTEKEPSDGVAQREAAK